MNIKKIDFLKKVILVLTISSLFITDVNSKDRLILKQKNGPQEVLDLDKLLMIRFVNITSVVDIYINDGDDKNIRIYPNPTKDKLLIKLEKIENIISKYIDVNIYNSNSQLIKSIKFNANDELEINLVDLNLSKGIYFININDNNQVIKKSKFILE